MARKYAALLSPIRVGDVILRNRMISTASTPHFLQAKEPFPTEKLITHFANRAKSGAAAVTINHLHSESMPVMGRAIDDPPCHFNLLDMDDPSGQSYLCQMLDAIHFYGAKATGYIMSTSSIKPPPPPGGPEAGPGAPPPPPPGGGAPQVMTMENDRDHDATDDDMPGMDQTDMTPEEMREYIDDYVQQAVDLKRLGFDIVSVYSCYRRSPHVQFFSPITNRRTDEYGGSLENRSRFILELFAALRKALGKGYPIECVFSVSEPEGGYTVEDTIAFAKAAEGLIDILHLRGGEQDPQHPLGFTSTEEIQEPYAAEMARVTRAVHEMGLNMAVGASAGFFDPERADRAVREGEADLICMARSWISNPEYGKLISEGRGEDIVPCIRCNKCHVSNGKDMFRSVCSVNPLLGLEDKIERMTAPPEKQKRVAVVGGGPAGMYFARTAAQRGHLVTLYEASDALGGLLRHADYPSFKWPLRQFKDFLIREMSKPGIEVLLNTPATKQALAAAGYDAVAVAIGARSVMPPLPGAEGKNVWFATDIYGDEEKLGDSVAVVGGGEIGVETALYLCELGKKVTVVEMLPELIADAPHAHYKNMVHNYWRRQPNFSFFCGSRCTAIEPEGLRITDSTGAQRFIKADSVLISVGTRALTDEALALHGAAPVTVVIGDCEKAGNVQKAVRQAYGAACTL